MVTLNLPELSLVVAGLAILKLIYELGKFSGRMEAIDEWRAERARK